MELSKWGYWKPEESLKAVGILCCLAYEGHSEMIWTQLICRNFIIFRLDIKQLLAQHIP
jgi:hypothetical protein